MATVSTKVTAIPSFLGRVRLRLYRHEARRAWGYGIASVAGLALVLPLIGQLLGENRRMALTILTLGGLAGALAIIGAIILGVVAPRRRYGSDSQVARWVGSRRRDVASDLLSAVELAKAPARPGAPSSDLVAALQAATSERIQGISPDGLLDRGEVTRARRWALAAVCSATLLAALAPGLVGAGWKRLLFAPPAPYNGATLSAVPLVGDLNARLEFPAYTKRAPVSLESSSGDVRGLVGTTVKLAARALVAVKSAELVIETDGQPEQRVDVKVEVAPRLGPNLEPDFRLSAQFVIQRAARYRFAITAPDGKRSIETTPRLIEAEPDQAPTVQLMAPAEPLDVTNLRRVELAYVIEDDFGITSAELVWEGGKDRGKKPISLVPVHADASGSQDVAPGGRALGKVLWDIAEVQVPSGGEVRYWIEAKDNDSIAGPNIGRSRELHLKVVSPRERHEETLGKHEALAEKLLANLGGRLVLSPDAQPADREELGRQLREVVIELGTVGAAYEKDPHASDALRKSLDEMRERLEKLANLEARVVPKGKTAAKGAYASVDTKMIAELEDDVIELADWLDRERMEGVLDISDEIGAHQERLADLLKQYGKSKDPRLLAEIEREMKALERAYAELDKHRQGMTEDVLDQYVNRDAVESAQGTNCLEEVRALVNAGDAAGAAAKLEQCRAQHDRASSALEGSLAEMRGDRFSDEQRKLDEVMNELADVAQDQEEIAAEANRIFESYADKADEIAKEHRREASKSVGQLVDKLRKRLADLDETGLTPFAKEELDIVQRRLTDVETMVADGDLAEALGMAQQAKQSLDTIAGELEAALEDDPTSKWSDATEDALEDIGKARPIAQDLIEELQSLSPSPDEIMSDEDKKSLDRLRRREAMTKGRAQKLAERAKQLQGELPGDTGTELGKKLGSAVGQMGQADERMKAKDPSGTREATRAAADALAKARDRARSAARQAQEGGSVGDEPIRIPGADEYRAPERFREDLLEAMKKKGQQGPDGYDEQIQRYYEELIK